MPGASGGRVHIYSQAHDRDDNASFEARVDEVAGRAEGRELRGDNASGLDAVTFLAAEGARFEPVRRLGSRGSAESHFFVKDTPQDYSRWNDDGLRFVEARDLVGMWRDHFNYAYNISTAQLTAVVQQPQHSRDALNNGVSPPTGWHFNLSVDAPYHQET